MIITEFGPQETLTVRRPPALGRVYYVSHFAPGADTNNGIDPGTPFLTITYALTQCVANRNDYIVVLDCWAEATETWPIPVSVDRVHIVGMTSPNAPYTKIKPPDATNTAVMNVTGDYVEIAGFDFGSGDDHGGVELSQGRNCWIHHCQFGSVEANKAGGLPIYGISVYADSNTFCLVEDCHFLGQDANAGGCIGIHGITTAGAPGAVSFGWSVIRNCMFQGIPACGIYIDLTSSMVIQDNVFSVPDAVNGEAITLDLVGGVTHGNFIKGNVAGMGMLNAGYTFNPFRDLNGNTQNAWAMNYRGNQVIEPVGI